MHITLAKEFYPIQFAYITKAEFEDELNIDIKETIEPAYIIEIEAKLKNKDLNTLVGNFLNRFLEITIIENFG